VRDSVGIKVHQYGAEQIEQSREIMETLHQILLKNGADIIQRHTENTQQIFEHNNESIIEAMAALLDCIEEMKTEMSASILQTAGKLKETYEFIDGKAAQIVSNYDQSAESYKDAVQNAHDWNEKVSTLLETVETSIENQQATNENVQQTLDVMEERQENIENLVAKIQEMSAAIETLQQLENQLNRIGR
jgi:methyl-accepting chemotaxis protein